MYRKGGGHLSDTLFYFDYTHRRLAVSSELFWRFLLSPIWSFLPGAITLFNHADAYAHFMRRKCAISPTPLLDFKDGTINADQYRINKEKCEQAQKELTANIKKLKASLGEADTEAAATNEFIEHFKKHGNIDRLTRPILTELIDRIVVHEDGTLDIAFNFCDAFEIS